MGDTAVVGISKDTPQAQAKFDAKYSLGFPSSRTSENATARAYGAWGKGMYGREGVLRSAFLVDEKGKVAKAWYRVKADQTAAKLLDVGRVVTDLLGGLEAVRCRTGHRSSSSPPSPSSCPVRR